MYLTVSFAVVTTDSGFSLYSFFGEKDSDCVAKVTEKEIATQKEWNHNLCVLNKKEKHSLH